MEKLKLTKPEIRDLEKTHKTTENKRFADRLKVIIAMAKGYTYDQIEEILLIDERTARRYKALFLEGGIDLLFSVNYKGRPSKLSPEQEKELVNHLQDNLYGSAKEIVQHIQLTYKVDYKPEGLVILLRRLGFSYKKTRPVPAKADKSKQLAFLEKYYEIREKLATDEGLFFMDAFHPTHNVMPAYAWIKKGSNKEIKRDRKSVV